MTGLDLFTWIRFIVWIGVGLIIYFAYGLWNSNERYSRINPISETSNGQVEQVNDTTKVAEA